MRGDNPGWSSYLQPHPWTQSPEDKAASCHEVHFYCLSSPGQQVFIGGGGAECWFCFGGVTSVQPAHWQPSSIMHEAGNPNKEHIHAWPVGVDYPYRKMRNIFSWKVSIYHHSVFVIILGFYSCAILYLSVTVVRNESNSTHHINQEQRNPRTQRMGLQLWWGEHWSDGRWELPPVFCSLPSFGSQLAFVCNL